MTWVHRDAGGLEIELCFLRVLLYIIGFLNYWTMNLQDAAYFVQWSWGCISPLYQSSRCSILEISSVPLIFSCFLWFGFAFFCFFFYCIDSSRVIVRFENVFVDGSFKYSISMIIFSFFRSFTDWISIFFQSWLNLGTFQCRSFWDAVF